MKCSPVILVTVICVGLAASIVAFSINPSGMWTGVAIAGTFVVVGACLTRMRCEDDDILPVLQRSQRGIYKRIDENRELLELLQQKAPDLLKENFWVEGWLRSQDLFLTDLTKFAPTEDPRITEGRYPRPWPGKA